MNFKLLYIFGFFFVGVKSRGVTPGGDTVPYTDSWYNQMKDVNPSDIYKYINPTNPNHGTANDEEQTSETPKESTWDKVKGKLQPAASQLSGLKDKLPKEWKNPFAKGNKDEESDLGIGNLFDDAQGGESPQKNPLFGGFNPGEKLGQAKDAWNNMKLPWGKKNHDSESPSNDDDPVQGIGDLFGEGEQNPKKNPFSEKFGQAKDAWNNMKLPWGKKNHDSESPSNDGDPVQGIGDLFGEGEESPQKNPLFGGFNPGEKLGQAKDAWNNMKLPWGKKNHDSESPANDDDPVQGVGDLFGEGEENPKKNPLFGGFNPGEKLGQAKDAWNNLKLPWGKKNHDSESPPNNDDPVQGVGDLFGEGEENPKKNPLFGGFNPGEKLGQAKEAWNNLNFPWGKKNHDSESPKNDHDSVPSTGNLSDHWPLHGLNFKNPFHSGTSKDEPENTHGSHHPEHNTSGEGPIDSGSEKHSHTPETPEEMLEEELEEIEKLAENPGDSNQWPEWNPSWDDANDQEPESHKPHSKEHENHHHHHPHKEHSGSPEKEHEDGDTSKSEQFFPDWFGKSDEDHKPSSKSHHEEPEEEGPEHESGHPSQHQQFKSDDSPSGKFIPNWLWNTDNTVKKGDPESEQHHHHHHHHSPLYEETNFDVREIGGNKQKNQDQERGKDSDEEDEDEDDGSDDEEDEDEKGDGNETDNYDTEDDNDIGHQKNKPGDNVLDPDEEEMLRENQNNGKGKPKRNSDDEADDDDSSDSDDDEDDDDDDEADDNAELDKADANFSIVKFLLPKVLEHLPIPSIPNPFSLMNRVTVSFASINDLQKDPQYLQKSLIKKVNQKYKESNEDTLPGTTISFWPPTISRG